MAICNGYIDLECEICDVKAGMFKFANIVKHLGSQEHSLL